LTCGPRILGAIEPYGHIADSDVQDCVVVGLMYSGDVAASW